MTATALVRNTKKLLQDRYPQCFCPPGTVKKPLKVCIQQDLYASSPEIPADLIRKVLVDYCCGASYLVALLTVGTPRVDLKGKHDGIVTEKHAAQAAERLMKIPAKIREKLLTAAGVTLPEIKNPGEAGKPSGVSMGKTLEGSTL